MSASDKFKSVAAAFQIFKDGEAVSARKLDGIIRRTQDGADKIEKALGDSTNKAIAFSGLQLFQNSLARSIGPTDELTIAPIRVFDIPQDLSSTNRGLARYPYSTESAVDVGNRSQNLLPVIGQQDKIGIGCIHDDGTKCLQRFDDIYKEEKTILPNSLFNEQLAEWQTSGVLFDGTYARLDNTVRYNTLPYSRDFDEWTIQSGLLVSRAYTDPNGTSSATSFQATEDGANNVFLELAGAAIPTASTDWCFSVWMASLSGVPTAFLEIDGATHVRSTQGSGAITPDQSIYAVDVSGLTWHRYYVYGTTSSKTSGVARLHLGRGNLVESDSILYIWGAQLEPTTYPSDYQATSGSMVSGLVDEVYLGKDFPSVPGHWYQISVEWEQISGAAYSIVADGVTVLDTSTDTSVTKTFQPLQHRNRETGYRTSNVHIYSSGILASGLMKLKNFRVDPGTPCHAMNCPGFSAYEKNRRYRATLPNITTPGSQYYGDQLKFPDEVSVVETPNLPANTLGVFDHEQNHTVPNRLVEWKLANWPIGNDQVGASTINDPEFLSLWTEEGFQEWPEEFNKVNVNTMTALQRGVDTQTITAQQGFTGNITEAIVEMTSGTLGYPDAGLFDGTGSSNVLGPVTGPRRFRFKLKPYVWFPTESRDGNGFGLYVSNNGGGGWDGSSWPNGIQYWGINSNGYIFYYANRSSDGATRIPQTTLDQKAITPGEWNDIELVISGSQATTDGMAFAFINGEFAGSGTWSITSDWGGGSLVATARSFWLVNPENPTGDAFRGYVAGMSVENSYDWDRYPDYVLHPGKTIAPFPSIRATTNEGNYLVCYDMRDSEDFPDGQDVSDSISSPASEGLYSLEKLGYYDPLDRRTTNDMKLMGLRHNGHVGWKESSFRLGSDSTEYSGICFSSQYDGSNRWRVVPRSADTGGFTAATSQGYFETIVQFPSGTRGTNGVEDGNLILFSRHVPGGISGMPVINYEIGINVSGGPYCTIAGFNDRVTTWSPIPGAPDGYEACYAGNAYSGVTLSGNWFFNGPELDNFIDVRDGLTHHILVRVDKLSASTEDDFQVQVFVDGTAIASGTFIGPAQSGVDWTEWDDLAGGGDRGWFDWSQEFYPAASGNFEFNLFYSNVSGIKASGTIYQFACHEDGTWPWNFSTSGFSNYTQRIPFPRYDYSTSNAFFWCPLDEGWGGRIHTMHHSRKQWDAAGISFPYPGPSVAEAVGYNSSARGVTSKVKDSAAQSDFHPEYGYANAWLDPEDMTETKVLWLDAEWAFSGLANLDDIDQWEDRSSSDNDFVQYDSGDVPVVFDSQLDVPDYWGRRFARMPAGNGYHLRCKNGVLQVAGDFTFVLVYVMDGNLYPVFGNDDIAPGGFGSDSNDGFTCPVAWNSVGYGMHYDRPQGGTHQPLTSPLIDLIPYEDAGEDETCVVIVRRDSSNNHYVIHNGIDLPTWPFISGNGAPLNIHGLFTLDSDSKSSTNSKIGELLVFDEDIGEEQARRLYRFMAEKWGVGGMNRQANAHYSWVRTDEVSTAITSGTPADRLEITVAGGETGAIEKAVSLEKNEVITLEYEVRGNLSYSGVREVYTVASGTAEVDLELTNTYTPISGANNPLYNYYQVSGSVLPGDDNFWAESANGGWTITRRVKATSDDTWVVLQLGVEGILTGAAAKTVTFDSFDILSQQAQSSKFTYCDSNVLGLNWDGRGSYVRDENLFQFSDAPILWTSSGITVSQAGQPGSIALAYSQVSGYIEQVISGANLLDDTFTLSWYHAAYSQSSGVIRVVQGATVQEFDWDISTSRETQSLSFSGIVYETGANLQIQFVLYDGGNTVVFGEPQLIHGSGIVDYVGTLAEPVRKYRRVIAPNSPQTVSTEWAPGYAIVEGGLIQTTQVGVVDPTGSAWAAAETRGFPAEGVIRVGGQEYGYRTKASGFFFDTVPGWRGTTYDPPAVPSGSRITNVPIPQSITAIDPDTKEITFRDVIPAPVGDWENNVNLQIYNTHVSNLDRFSLQASAVPITRALGNMLVTFVQHVSDHRRHFRFSNLCAQILDSSSWCASPVIVTEVTVETPQVEELTQQAQITVTAKRFVPASSKKVTVRWGDGQSTVVTGTGTVFKKITHTYDLKQLATTKTYTIRVVVEDLDLNFSRLAIATVKVRPKVNSAGQPTKSSIKASAKLIVPQTNTTSAGAKMKNQVDSSTSAGAKMVLP